VDFDPETGRGARAFHRLTDAVLRETAGALRDVERAKSLRLSEPARNFAARSLTAWLTRSELGRVNAAFRRVERIFAMGLARRRGRLHLTTFVRTPVVRSRHGPAPGPDGEG